MEKYQGGVGFGFGRGFIFFTVCFFLSLFFVSPKRKFGQFAKKKKKSFISTPELRILLEGTWSKPLIFLLCVFCVRRERTLYFKSTPFFSR